ncbi:MAG: sigma-70 family RNA polymerase sigma factor [Phycisphaerae bacterium]|jgi:RNA polymerase sigma-70 factor (ECF subfamily)
MIEDELLKYRFKHGSSDALARIYQKYGDYLLSLGIALLNDVNSAEDVLQDVFVRFASSAKTFRIRGNLKSYLATCVVNRCRDEIRAKKHKPVQFADAEPQDSTDENPYNRVLCTEQSRQVGEALSKLPYEQREVIVLRLQSDLRFTKIAKLQQACANTVRGRYRYGIEKLRSLLDGEIEK